MSRSCNGVSINVGKVTVPEETHFAAAMINHDISRLYITMHNATRVHEIQCLAHESVIGWNVSKRTECYPPSGAGMYNI